MGEIRDVIKEMMAEIVTLKTLLSAADFRIQGIGDCTVEFDRKLRRNITMALIGGHRNAELYLSDEQRDVRKAFADAPLHQVANRL
jgi:hypothetical protein